MKKTILSVALAVCAILTVSAQKPTFGVKGGLNFANLTNNEDSKRLVSGHIGGFVNFEIAKNLSIQPEILYSGQGSKYDGNDIEDETSIKTKYINIPVMVQYRFIPELFVEAGPQIGFMTAAKGEVGKISVDIKDQMKAIDFSLGLGVGYQFPIGIGVSARYMFGLSNVIDNDETGDPEKYKNTVGQIGVFYTFRFKK